MFVKKNVPKRLVLSSQEKLQTLFQISLMLCQKVSIVQSLEIVLQTQKSKKIQKGCLYVLDQLSHGRSVAESVNSIFKIPAYFYAILRSGEQTGHLGSYLMEAYLYAKKQSDMKAEQRSQAFYPAFVFVSTFLLSCGIIAFAIPNMMSMAQSLQLKLPSSFLAISSFSNWLGNYWPFLIVGFFSLMLLLLYLYKKNRYWVDWVLLKIPIYKYQIRKKELLSLFSLLSMLLKDQIPLEKALDLSLETIQKEPLRDELSLIFQQIHTGELDFMQFAPYFGKQVSFLAFLKSSVNKEQLIENTDFLVSVMSKEMEDQKKRVTKLIEPVSLGLIGLMVLFVITKVYLPIFEMFGSMEWMSGF
jgi:type IV pilus assembly protein PilC